MNMFKKTAVVGGFALLAASVCLPSFAQGPGGRRGPQMVSVAEVPVPVLDQALKLTDDQKTKIQAIESKLQDDTKALRPAPGTQVDQQTRRDNMQKMRDLTQTADGAVSGVLTTDQSAALKGLLKDLEALNFAGVPPAALPELNLTADQKGKLIAIGTAGQADLQTKMTAAGDDRSQYRQIYTQSRQDVRAKADLVLTDDQKTTLKKYAPRGFGGGRRGGQ